MATPGMKLSPEGLRPEAAERFERRIVHAYFVRFHMTLILTAVIASGVLTSKGLLELGVRSLRLRYPVAVLASYLVFLLLVRVWIWYVSLRTAAALSVGNFDLGSVDGSYFTHGSGGSVHFGGGSSGGGGASDSWDIDTPSPSTASASFGSKSSFDFDLGGGDDDGWLVLLLLVALVFAIVGAGGYLVYAAPHILPEAALQAVLASSFRSVAKEGRHNWMTCVLRSTAFPFGVVLILAAMLGWEAHRHCPEAARMIDVFRCAMR
jgi:hypothetical protein